MALLQEPGNREIITKTRDDTSSLLWLRDDESHGTRHSVCTENSDFLDSSFIFDREIFSSRAYITAMKSNMKRVVRRAHSKAQTKSSSPSGFGKFYQSDDDVQTIIGDTDDIPSLPVSISVDSEAQPRAGDPSDLFAPDLPSSHILETTVAILSRDGSTSSKEGECTPKRSNEGG